MRRAWAFACSALFAASAAFAYDSVKSLGTFSDPALKSPTSVAMSRDRLYVGDNRADAIFIFDRASKKVIGRINGGTKKAAGLSEPGGIDIGPTGKVYVADTGSSRILLFDAEGKLIGSFGSPGRDLGQLKAPEDVTVGTDGRVYVADTGNSRVQIFAPDGIFLFSLGEEEKGKLKKPVRVQVDASDNVYVLDADLGKVRRFDARGRFAGDWTAAGAGMGVDRFGFLYAVDPETSKVSELDPSGQRTGTFGAEGSGPSQTKKPSDLALGPAGEIAVADTGNGRVLLFGIENKQKTSELPPNAESRLTLSGPVATAALESDLFAVTESGALFAHLPKEQTLAIVGPDGAIADRFAKRGKEKGQVRDPKGLSWSDKDGLFVSDYGNQRILRFNGKGEFQAVFGEKAGFFESRKKEGNLSSPEGIAINPDGTLYVADTGNRRIQAFNSDGLFLFSFGPKLGTKLELEEPTKLQWDPAGYLYILDRKAKRMLKTDPKGKLVATFGEVGEGIRQWQEPVAFAYDGNNYLFVLDQELGRVQVFDGSGRWLMNMFSKGKGPKELQAPSHLAVKGNRLYISDPAQAKIFTYEFHPVIAPPEGFAAKTGEGSAELSWNSPGNSWIEKYQLSRAGSPEGPYELIATTDALKVLDEPSLAYATYYYRLASVAKTGDVGPASKSYPVYVPGSFNAPPIQLSKIEMPDIFSANYKWYLKNPSGKIELTNNTDLLLKDVKLSFGLKDFMDYPFDNVIPELKPHERREIPLQATLNNRILDVNEDTPIQAEFKVTYYEKGKPVEITLTKPLKVLSRNAIIWDRSERLGNFITTKDPVVLEFGRAALLMKPKDDALPVNEKLKRAALLWEAFGSLGMAYRPDPINPYSKVKAAGGKTAVADTVQLPRETLRRKSGECGDLVAFMSSVLEGAALRVAFLDYPGHLNLMFDTGESDAKAVGLPEDQLVSYDNTLWVPVETTLVGKDFLESERKALSLYREAEKKGDVKAIPIEKAWEEFEPMTIPETEWRSPLPDSADVQARYGRDVERLAKNKYESLKSALQAELSKAPESGDVLTQLGALEAEFGHSDEAAARFKEALKADPRHPGALNDMGNLSYLKGDFAEAEKSYLAAADVDPQDAGIWMNLARTAFKQGDKDKFKQYSAKAVELNADFKPSVQALAERQK